MLNGLDLFSGIGGNTLALREWVRTVAYCEIDPHARTVLLSRMGNWSIRLAPIWDDVRTLRGDMFDVPIDIIVAGFPCQDISVAGRGAGLAGERSGLVFEVFRLVNDLRPSFVFLENVPAIRTRGGERVVKELAALGYDCRWDCLSAFDVGAPHKRERWFLLAHRVRERLEVPPQRDGGEQEIGGPRGDDPDRLRDAVSIRSGHAPILAIDSSECLTGPVRPDAPPWLLPYELAAGVGNNGGERRVVPACLTEQRAYGEWWATEPDVGRVAHGVPDRVDRLRGLGNAVVPAQAREAFRRLLFG